MTYHIVRRAGEESDTIEVFDSRRDATLFLRTLLESRGGTINRKMMSGKYYDPDLDGYVKVHVERRRG